MLPDLFKIKRSDVVVIVCFLIYAISFKLIHNITPQTVGSIPIFIISFAGVKLGIKKGLGYALIGAAISWLLYYSVQYNHFSTLAITSVVYILFGGFSGYIHMLKEKVLQKNGTLKKEMEMRAQFEKELQLIKDDLEDKVEIRTSELTAVNKLLKNEIENRELVEQKLNSRLKFEILISEVAQKFANVLDIEEIDDLINTTLKDLTDFIGFDRGYIFFKEEGSPVHIRKYFYHKENIPNGLSTPMIDISEYQVLGKYVFLENQILFSENQRDSSYKDEVAKLLEKFGVNAIIVSAVQFKDRPVGFIGFDQAIKRDTSNPVDLIFIKSIEKIIEGAIGKKIIFDELRTNKKRFENISNIIADFAFSINVVNGEVGSLEWVTDAFFIKTGYSKSKEMFEKGWQDVIYSEDLSKLYESFTKAINKKSVVDELRMITFNGSVRWFKFFIEPEFDAEGDVNKIIGGAQDITLQKTFDDILLQNEKKFHLIFDNNPFPMMLVDSRSLDILEINSSAVIQYGYTKEELLTMNYSQFYLDEDKTANIAELSDPHKSFSDPNLVKHLANDNKVLVVETYSHKMLFDNKSVFLVIPLDVTEKIKIANENKLLAHSIKSIQECVSITDEKNTIIYVNDAFCKTYGYESCELVGKNISILHGSSVPTDYSDKVAVKTLEEGYRGEFLNRKKNGIEFPISLTTSNVKDENGEILALIGVATDISDRKENEKALLDAANYAQLEKAKTETIIKSIGESVRIVDLKFNISYQNEICEEHFSIKSGKPCYSLFNREKPCEDCPLFVSNWDGHILHREKVIDSKDTTRYYDLTISALKDSAGNITSVIELAKETTAKKEIELSLKEKVSQLELISGLIFGFKDIFNIKSLIKYIYDVFPEYIPNVDGMSVQLYDSGRDELYGAKNLLFDDAEYRKKSTNKISFTNLAGRCFLESKPIYIEDCKTSSLNDKGYFLDNKIISTVMVPLAIKQKKIGVLRFDNKNKVNAFSHNDIEYFQVIAEQLAMLIENDKLIEGIKNSEKELADSKDYLNNMINALRMGVIAIEPETHTVVDINKYAVELIGAPREYLLGKMCHKFICPAERDKCPVTDLHQEVDSSERILLNYKNEKIPILKSVVPITYKEKKYLVESFIDITDIKRIEKELRENEEKLSVIFKNMIDVVMFIDEEFKILNVTPSIKELTGYSAELVMNKFLLNSKLMTEESYRLFKAYIEDLFNSKDEGRKIIDFKNNITGMKKVEVFGSKCYLNGKQYVIVVLRDLTAKIFAEEALKEYNSELIQLNEKLTKSQVELKSINANKDKFFSIIAHDLRSPFNALLGFSDFLVNDYATLAPEEVKTFAGHINLSAKQLFNLLENLLQWSRIQTGRLEYKPVKLDLAAVVKTVFSLLNANALKKEILLSFEIRNNIFVFADKNAVNSVLQNLISNAIKFTNKGGFICAKATVKKNFVEIEVKDTGVGMSEANVAKLFKIEVQHSTTGTDNEQGSGLGLILCKELIEKNQGKIRVESEPGLGTSFIFTLPLAND